MRILVDFNTGQSRGCGFVMKEKRSEAEAAIRGLNAKPWPGSSAVDVVKYADSPVEKQKKGGGRQP